MFALRIRRSRAVPNHAAMRTAQDLALSSNVGLPEKRWYCLREADFYFFLFALLGVLVVVGFLPVSRYPVLVVCAGL